MPPCLVVALAERAATPDGGIEAHVAAEEPWLLDAYRTAWDWADATGWRPKG